MHTSQKGIGLIKKHEGCKLSAYLCPAGKLTIGYGHTGKIPAVIARSANDEAISLNTVITQAQADELFKNDLKRFEKAVNDLVKVPLNQNQFSALVSFTFNLGAGKLSKSTLLKLLNQGKYQEASKEFEKWVFSKGKKLNGLVKRRKEERELFNGKL